MRNRDVRILANPHIWIILLLFIVCIILHYPQQILHTEATSLFSFLGLTRHAVERILLLIPIGYVCFFLGTVAGFASLVVSALIMLPRVFLVSEYFPDALLETLGIIILGGFINLWFVWYGKDRDKRRQMLLTLEEAHQQLKSRTSILEKSQQSLDTINKISSTVSQSLELSQVLDGAIRDVINLMQVDAAWIYLLNESNTELVLASHRGYSDEFNRIKVGYGISGKVVVCAQPLVVEDVDREPDLPDSVKKQMRSVVVVPLISKSKVKGTLGVNSRNRRSFEQEEIGLLSAIGNQIGVAVENSSLYQKQLETTEKLRVSEQRYRQLFESARDAIWVHDLEGNFTDVNKASELLTGFPAEELLGMNVRSFLSGEHLRLAGQIKRQLLSGKSIEQPYDQHLIRKQGDVGIMRLTTNLIWENGKPVGFLHIARDITVEKRIQEELNKAYKELTIAHQQFKESQQQLIQAEKLTSLGQLAASIAHEVNNPLTGVLVYTQLLAKKIKSNEINAETSLDYLNKMESELIRSTKLIKNLLNFARQSPPAFKQINLNVVVEKTLELISHSAELQHIRVFRELDTVLPDFIADLDQLQQVITNLVLNAIDAMPAGGSLTLRTASLNNCIKLEVQDTGCGISPENMGKLFTPFFTTKPDVKGVGLGLAVAYGIIQRHKGKIDVQSKVGQGTVFTILLPMSPESDAIQKAPIR